MAVYNIRFFKNLSGTNGCWRRCLQDSVRIENARTPAEAAARAARQFESRRDIRDWHLHADAIDITEVRRAAASGARPTGDHDPYRVPAAAAASRHRSAGQQR